MGRYNWFGLDWRGDTSHIPQFEQPGNSSCRVEGGLHDEVSEMWEEWREGQRGKGRVNGNTPQKRGLGGGGGPRAGMGFGANSTQSRGGGRGGGGNGRGGERGGEHRDRSLTGRSPPGGGQASLDQDIQRGISIIRDQVERDCQDHCEDQVSRSVLQSTAQPVAQPPSDVTPYLSSSRRPLTLTVLPMDPSDDQAPTRLFEPLRELANCRMPHNQWDEWCRRLAAWTRGFSAWSHSRYVTSSESSKNNSSREAWKQRSQGRGNNPPQVQNSQSNSRNRAIRRKANLQKLYRINPKACMDTIRRSPKPPRCEVHIPVVHEYFKRKNDQPTLVIGETPPPFPVWPRSAEVDLLDNPFTEQEVEAVLRSLPNNSAPGPDRLRYADWKRLGSSSVSILTSVINTCRVNKKIPLSWKASSTILLHKAGDTINLDNWRPIALQNTIYKVYSGAIAKRLTCWAVETGKLSSSQTGFLPYEGCLEHNFVLRSVLQDARRRKKDLTVSWLDLKDAYSSVPHSILLRVLRMAGLGGSCIDIIKDIYTGSTTCVKTRSGSTTPIVCGRGVKQGCRLSPILFNFVMEAVIRAVEEVPDAGYKIANSSITSLAYADDLCVLSSSRSQMQLMLDHAHKASSWAGLTFNTRKCASLTILRGQGERQRAVPFKPKLGADEIPALSWSESYKYLGCRYGADPKVEIRKVGEEFLKDCEAIMRSDLCDWQKLDALHRFAKPRLVYPLQNLTPPHPLGDGP